MFAGSAAARVHDIPTVAELKRQSAAMAGALNVVGLMNVQFAIQNGTVFVLEVNPRYPASAELFEADDHRYFPLPAMKSTETAGADFNDGGTVRSFIRLHADVWQGQTVDQALQAAGIDPIRLPLGRGRARQAAMSSAIEWRSVMGMTARRCSSVLALRLIAMLTGSSSARRWRAG